MQKKQLTSQSGWWLKGDNVDRSSVPRWCLKGRVGKASEVPGACLPTSSEPWPPSPVSFAVTLCTHLWDRRLCASHLLSSAETACFCGPLPELSCQGDWGQQPGPFEHLTSCFCCCLTSFYREVQSLTRRLRWPCAGLPPHSTDCVLWQWQVRQHWWTWRRAVWPLRMCSCTSLGRSGSC